MSNKSSVSAFSAIFFLAFFLLAAAGAAYASEKGSGPVSAADGASLLDVTSLAPPEKFARMEKMILRHGDAQYLPWEDRNLPCYAFGRLELFLDVSYGMKIEEGAGHSIFISDLKTGGTYELLFCSESGWAFYGPERKKIPVRKDQVYCRKFSDELDKTQTLKIEELEYRLALIGRELERFEEGRNGYLSEREVVFLQRGRPVFFHSAPFIRESIVYVPLEEMLDMIYVQDYKVSVSRGGKVIADVRTYPRFVVRTALNGREASVGEEETVKNYSLSGPVIREEDKIFVPVDFFEKIEELAFRFCFIRIRDYAEGGKITGSVFVSTRRNLPLTLISMPFPQRKVISVRSRAGFEQTEQGPPILIRLRGGEWQDALGLAQAEWSMDGRTAHYAYFGQYLLGNDVYTVENDVPVERENLRMNKFGPYRKKEIRRPVISRAQLQRGFFSYFIVRKNGRKIASNLYGQIDAPLPADEKLLPVYADTYGISVFYRPERGPLYWLCQDGKWGVTGGYSP